MCEQCEDIFYYITLGNEKYPMPPMAPGAEEGILRGMYKLQPSAIKAQGTKVHLLGSGAILREALRAQELLAEHYGVAADVWSVTSYKELRRDALDVEHWNLLHPAGTPKQSYLQRLLAGEQGVYVAATDYLKLVPDMIQPWVPGGLYSLGTDGFGRSDNRRALRRFFEVDAESITLAALSRLAGKGEIKPARVEKAIKELDVDPEKVNPMQA
jgi:pyruvate dehydrogenase E1 component